MLRKLQTIRKMLRAPVKLSSAWILTMLMMAQPVAVQFVEVASSKSGIAWRHENGKSSERHLPETVSP